MTPRTQVKPRVFYNSHKLWRKSDGECVAYIYPACGGYRAVTRDRFTEEEIARFGYIRTSNPNWQNIVTRWSPTADEAVAEACEKFHFVLVEEGE